MREAKSFMDRAVASSVATGFKPTPSSVVVRKTIINVGPSTLLAFAAEATVGWLSILLWSWFALPLFPYLLLGLGQRAVDEKKARLAALPDGWREVLTSDKWLTSGRDPR